MKHLHDEKGIPDSELTFMNEAAISIIEARQMLRWAFVALYFFEDKGSTVPEGQLNLFKY